MFGKHNEIWGHQLENELISLNPNDLKFRKGAPLKHFFNINLGIGIIQKTTFFVRIFDISPCVFSRILIGRSCWMQNLIPHSMSPPNRNLSKKMGRYVENTNKKVVLLLLFLQN